MNFSPTEMVQITCEAREAGLEAGEAVNPTPMNLVGRSPDGTVTRFHEPEGMCGFAWVTIRPGNSRFANHLKKRGLASKAYGGGVQIWVSDFGQSHERKSAYARAYANVLTKYGVKAQAGNRLD